MHRRASPLLAPLLALALLAACARPAPAPAPAQPAPTATPAAPKPAVRAVAADRASLGRFERVELTVDLQATYQNPLDSQQVALDATFVAPSGARWEIPGFWDGKKSWRVRFTPGEAGEWRYTVRVRDAGGAAESPEARLAVTPSERHGWLQVASWLDPKLSPRYLAYRDGTPFYGVGHCDAFTLGDARMDSGGDLVTLKRMQAAGENLVVWWPHYTFTFFRGGPASFDPTDMALIDSYLASADRLGIAVVYTVWDHNLLRGPEHPWGNGRWADNGFSRVTPSAAAFFTDETSWRWQENFYRYIIARWGYSPSIIWMTVSELDGTSGGKNMDAWHARINGYFVKNDPYRHPTTASLAGDQWWPAGYAVTDIPQAHVYAAQQDAVKMGESVADWTARMWAAQPRPNVVGEFGTTTSSLGLPMLHDSIWGALASGAAITPLRWSDRGAWGRMNPRLMEQLGFLAAFVQDVPFPQLDLRPAEVAAEGGDVAARAMAGPGYAIAWARDRAGAERVEGVRLTIAGLADGSYRVRPFDTWSGTPLPEQRAAASGGRITVELPPFAKDIALKIDRAP